MRAASMLLASPDLADAVADLLHRLPWAHHSGLALPLEANLAAAHETRVDRRLRAV